MPPFSTRPAAPSQVVANFGVGYDNIDLDAALSTRGAGHEHPGCPQQRDRRARGRADACGSAADHGGGRRGSPRGLASTRCERADRPGAGRRDGRARGLRSHRPPCRAVASRVRGAAARDLTLERYAGAWRRAPRAHRAPGRLGLRQRARAPHSGDEAPDRRERPGGHEAGRNSGSTPVAAPWSTRRRSSMRCARAIWALPAWMSTRTNRTCRQRLRGLPNTVLLPHVGSATATTRDAMARLCADNVVAVLDGRDPPTAVV